MILLIARLPGSPVTFMVPELSRILTGYFPRIEIKIFDPEYILSTLDTSYSELAQKVSVLRNSHTSLDVCVREELFKVFNTVLLEPYDLLIVEGLIRSHKDVERWQNFFASKQELVFVIEDMKEDMRPLTLESSSFRRLISACINSGSTHFGTDMSEPLQYMKKRLSQTLEHLSPV